jgi:hypothetical protein
LEAANGRHVGASFFKQSGIHGTLGRILNHRSFEFMPTIAAESGGRSVGMLAIGAGSHEAILWACAGLTKDFLDPQILP